MWHIVHDESITANENLTIWMKDASGLDREILFERNSQGLEIAYYHTAFDGIYEKFPAAKICYGWDVIQMENNEKDAFLERVVDNQDIHRVLSCEHDFTCEEIFHAAAVMLSNEECDGCEPCARYGYKEEA